MTTHTAMHEHYGSCYVASPSADVNAPLPFGPGCARLIDLDPSTAISCILPDARMMHPGGQVQFLIINRSATDAIDVLGADLVLIDSIATGSAMRLWLLDNATLGGEWYATQSTATIGTSLSASREPWDVVLNGQLWDFNLQDHLTDLGWDGTTPVAIRCTLSSTCVVGSTSVASPPAVAFTTGTGWPTGSTLMLILESGAVISGRGGAGGRGSSIAGLLSSAGSDGGLGLYVGMDTTLVSYGTIAGGGGGGGGGGHLSQTPGGGGGGGAGLLFSAGGAAGTGGSNSAQAGLPGSLWVAGGGGYGAQTGGTGGGPGQDGSASGAAGGTAGDAINYLGTVTWTKIRWGTRSGDEVSV